MPRVWLSIGSNIDPESNIRGAVHDLRETFGELVISTIYETAAVGFEGPNFCNLVVGLDTQRSIAEINMSLGAIESAHGRKRGKKKFASRTLDIDLLTYGDAVIRVGDKQVPRDEILRYAFVLKPLAEVAAREVHPVLGRTYAELWDAFDHPDQTVSPAEFQLA